MMPDLAGIVRKWQQSVRQVQTTKLIVLPSLTGALTGAATIAFVQLIGVVRWAALGSAAQPLQILSTVPWYRIFLAPVLGGLILGPLVVLLAPEAEGHGVPEVIEAVTLTGGRIKRRVALVKSLASAITIGSGGSVGREGPVVHIGAGVGSALGQALRLPAEQLKTLTACGAGSGIAAVFNAPIAGAFFALEVVTGNFAMPAFAPVVLSSVLATVVSRAYFGDHPAFIVQPYELGSAFEIIGYLGLGVFCGLVSVAFVSVLDNFERYAAASKVPRILRPAVGGLALGVMLIPLPYLYGVGYGTMDRALNGTWSWQILALLVPLKIIATSLTLASGGSGGVFLPSLYIGSVAGGLYGTIAHFLFPHVTAGSGAYALVGMAGVLAAATHSPITAMILLFEVTADYKIILPVMIVATLSTMVARAFKEDSLYTLRLSQRGIALSRREDLIMRSHTVGQVMRPVPGVLDAGTTIDQVVRHFLTHELVYAYVVDSKRHFAGVISIHDIKDPSLADLGPLVVAGEIADRNVSAVSATDTLADCIDLFVAGDRAELPVLDADRTLLGVVSRQDVLRVYSSELLRHEYLGVTAAAFERGASGSGHFADGFTVTRITTPAWLAGRSLREANLRGSYNLTVVAVRRATQGNDQLPDPAEPLRRDDVLVVVGTAADIERFRGASEAP